MIADLIKQNRSYRRFYQNHVLDLETLTNLVDLARLSASAANLQPLRYIISVDPSKNSQIFSCLGWAGYLKDWNEENTEKNEATQRYQLKPVFFLPLFFFQYP